MLSLHCYSLYVGVELDQPQGKNDGSVDGTRYFTCKPNHGLFTPSSKVKRCVTNSFPNMVIVVNSTLISKYRLFRRLDSVTQLSSMSSAYEASPDSSPTASRSDTPTGIKSSSLTRTGSLRREKKSNPTTPRCGLAFVFVYLFNYMSQLFEFLPETDYYI